MYKNSDHFYRPNLNHVSSIINLVKRRVIFLVPTTSVAAESLFFMSVSVKDDFRKTRSKNSNSKKNDQKINISKHFFSFFLNQFRIKFFKNEICFFRKFTFLFRKIYFEVKKAKMKSYFVISFSYISVRRFFKKLRSSIFRSLNNPNFMHIFV